MDKYDMIVSAEQQFAREVTLGVIVTRPLTAWHCMIRVIHYRFFAARQCHPAIYKAFHVSPQACPGYGCGRYPGRR
jgi:hypothetical protein